MQNRPAGKENPPVQTPAIQVQTPATCPERLFP